jgi:hypothetical protein
MIRANVQVSQFLIRTAEVDKVLNDLRNSVNENRYRSPTASIGHLTIQGELVRQLATDI